jgi:hypothetical protein
MASTTICGYIFMLMMVKYETLLMGNKEYPRESLNQDEHDEGYVLPDQLGIVLRIAHMLAFKNNNVTIGIPLVTLCILLETLHISLIINHSHLKSKIENGSL